MKVSRSSVDDHVRRARSRRADVAGDRRDRRRTGRPGGPGAARGAGVLEAVEVSAWFGGSQVLDDVSLSMPSATVTALIGPSGCGKSTFLRILNRMHESVPGAQLAGEVHLNGEDIYAPGQRLTEPAGGSGWSSRSPTRFRPCRSPTTSRPG